MTSEGYVRLHRRVLGHPAFRNDGEALAFAWMVIRASWKPARIRYKEHTISLNRGELAVSIRDLAEALDRPKGWVERLIFRLKNETMVGTRRATQSKTAPLVISITNYDTYQSSQDSDGTREETLDSTPEGTAAGQRQDREQGREEDKKKEIRRLGRSERLPEHWMPKPLTGVSAETVRSWPPARVERELAQFRDHHIARGSAMKDWDAAWRTWIGNADRFAPRASPMNNGFPPGHSGIPI